eukprot:gb/GFBE01041279.1/.p1 GENE.gb/GFBE01041279.1/~~gb/GFBE01041279.1/.p1  ORF type:complete len:368 (+),score=55.95 gb/GFBE01041279.1/:1-1104(+)
MRLRFHCLPIVALLVSCAQAHRDDKLGHGKLDRDVFLSNGSQRESSLAQSTAIGLLQSLTSLRDIPDTWAEGIVICFVGNTLRAIGLVLQKYSHCQSEPDALYLTQRWWLVGFVLFICSQLLCAAAMPMAPQVVLSCIGTWSIVVTPFCAWAILGETLQGVDLASTLGVCIGLVMVIAGTATSKFQAIANVDVLVGQILAPHVLSLVAMQAVFLITLHFLLCREFPNLKPLAWALTAALLSGPAVMLSKCVMTLLLQESTSGAESPWSRPEPWMFLLAALALMALLTHSLALGLQTGSAFQVLPVYYAVGMLSQLLMAVVAFKEIEEFPQEGVGHVLSITAGVVLLLVSIAALSSSKRPAQKPLQVP